MSRPPVRVLENAICLLSGDHAGSKSFAGLLVDRKSTRLNSSHLVISYAVFCLKKKNVLTAALVGAVFTMLPFSGQGKIANIRQHSYASDMKLQAKRSPVYFLPDGDPYKPSCKRAESVEFDTAASGNSHFPEISTRVSSVWTAKHI